MSPNQLPLSVQIVTNIPSPYQVDFFSELARSNEILPFVVFCSCSERDRSFSVPPRLPFPHSVLEGQPHWLAPKDWHHNPELKATLQANLPADVGIVSGSYFMPSARTARSYFLRQGIPWVYWGEDPAKKLSGLTKRALKDAYIRWFLKPASGVLGMGSRACNHYRPLMTKRTALSSLPYAPDLSGLMKPSSEVEQQADQLRGSWPVSDPTVLLFSGSLSQRKAPELLLRVFERVNLEHDHLCLMFAGSGPMMEELRIFADKLESRDRVRFLGFVEGDELKAAYLSADLLVLPTRTHEGWGVVVQEAMAAGLPVIATDRVGAAVDLVSEGETGWVIPPDDADALASCIGQFADCSDASSRERFADRCRQQVQPHDSRQRARELADFLGGVCEAAV